MKLLHTETVAAPREQIWAAFMDLKRVGRCFPGAEVTEVDGDDFVGNVKAKIGPFGLTFTGTGTLTVADETAGHARIESTGSESHGFGKADIVIDLHLHEPDAAAL